MKKIITMVLCIALALSMFGCGVQKEKPLYPDANETEQPILSEEAQAKQVAKEFCLDNGYTDKEIFIREGGSEGYVLDIIADKHNETKQITLTVRKLENGSSKILVSRINNYTKKSLKPYGLSDFFFKDFWMLV